MDMKKRREATKALAIPFGEGEGGDTLNIVYRPSRLTVASLRTLAEAEASAVAAQKTAPAETTRPESEITRITSFVESVQEEVFSQVLSWDLTDGGEPVPLTLEGMAAADVDIPLCTAILVAIREDQSPKPTKPTNSGSFA